MSDIFEEAKAKVEAQLQAALKEIRNGKCPEEVFQSFSRKATNTLLHPPTKVLREQRDSDLIKAILGIE